MKKALLWLLIATLPAHAAMDITRELDAPALLVPGQPVRVAVTYWTDSWFNPPPEWPDFAVKNGELLSTPLPSQLVTRKKNGITWSGIRLERQAAAWEQGTLRLPAVDVTVASASQGPVTVHLPALERRVKWPAGITQADHFLPASRLTMTQDIRQYHAGKASALRVGDVIDRIVTVDALDALPAQIPPLLYAIAGRETQRLTPINTPLQGDRGDVTGTRRVERLRYLPTQSGTLVLPPVKLRWWNTASQQWQVAELAGETLRVAPARAAGAEASLRGTTAGERWWDLLWGTLAVLFIGGMWFTRRGLERSLRRLYGRWRNFWQPQSLPPLTPSGRKPR